jgi:hypothetical protein
MVAVLLYYLVQTNEAGCWETAADDSSRRMTPAGAET